MRTDLENDKQKNLITENRSDIELINTQSTITITKKDSPNSETNIILNQDEETNNNNNNNNSSNLIEEDFEEIQQHQKDVNELSLMPLSKHRKLFNKNINENNNSNNSTDDQCEISRPESISQQHSIATAAAKLLASQQTRNQQQQLQINKPISIVQQSIQIPRHIPLPLEQQHRNLKYPLLNTNNNGTTTTTNHLVQALTQSINNNNNNNNPNNSVSNRKRPLASLDSDTFPVIPKVSCANLLNSCSIPLLPVTF
jgi:hypothetical protein